MKPTLFFLLCALLIPVPAASAGVDRADMEHVEDLTEEFANSLHDLSFLVREGNVEAFREHLSETLTASGIPPRSGPGRPYTRWTLKEPLGEAATGLGPDGFLESWATHLKDFSEMEDVRLKVKKAKVLPGTPARLDAKLKFYWVGRDLDGRRRWVKGTGHATATRGEAGRWHLDTFGVDTFRSLVAERELFSEVSVPAGTAQRVPRWGEPGNEVFLAHGVATQDVDNDGLIDVFVTGNDENFLYRNRGDGTFENIALETLLGITPAATGPLFVDFDGDGDQDLFLAATGTQMLFENRLVPDGELVFDDVSDASGVARNAEGYSALAADVNSDGHPDIYVCSYNKYGQVMPNSWSDATNGTPNLLFLNNGDGTFREAGEEWGCADPRWTYASMFADLNEDGHVDLYVANDFGLNALYLNDGTRFRNATDEFGLEDPGNGMGVSFGDMDNDGDLDLHVTNMSSTAGKRILGLVFGDEEAPEYVGLLDKLASGNTLFRNTGDGFEDVSSELGPFSAGWAFGGGFVDFDNDGLQDIHSPNGFISGKGLKDT